MPWAAKTYFLDADRRGITATHGVALRLPTLRATLATLRRAGTVIDLGLRPLSDDEVESLLTAEVEDRLALRQDTVSPHAQDVLGALGVADSPVSLPILATVTGHPLDLVEDALDWPDHGVSPRPPK